MIKSTRDPLDSPAAGPYLLQLFKQDMKAKLVQAGIDAVRPAIEQAAEEACASLQLTIKHHYDVREQRTLVQCLVKGVKP